MAGKTRGIRVEQDPKRVRAYLGGELVADTKTPFLVWEWPYFPTYYFPAANVRAELVPAGQTEHSPSRGDGQVYHIKVAGGLLCVLRWHSPQVYCQAPRRQGS
jgi:uncharacterized protein (DUF427 family)